MEEANQIFDHSNLNFETIYEEVEPDPMVSWTDEDTERNSLNRPSAHTTIYEKSRPRKKRNLFKRGPLNSIAETKAVEVPDSNKISSSAIENSDLKSNNSVACDIFEACYSAISNDRTSRLAIDIFLNDLSPLSKYLSSDWSFDNELKRDEGINENFDFSAHENVREAVDRMTSEISTFVLSHVTAYTAAYYNIMETKLNDSDILISDLNSVLIEAVKVNATLNATYCAKILRWLMMKYSHEMNARENSSIENLVIFNEDLQQEYFNLAPGPWREVILLVEMSRVAVPTHYFGNKLLGALPSHHSPLSPPRIRSHPSHLLPRI